MLGKIWNFFRVRELKAQLAEVGALRFLSSQPWTRQEGDVSDRIRHELHGLTGDEQWVTGCNERRYDQHEARLDGMDRCACGTLIMYHQ